MTISTDHTLELLCSCACRDAPCRPDAKALLRPRTDRHRRSERPSHAPVPRRLDAHKLCAIPERTMSWRPTPPAVIRTAEAELRAERQRLESRLADRRRRAGSHAGRRLLEASADRATARSVAWDGRHLACLLNLDRSIMMREARAAQDAQRSTRGPTRPQSAREQAAKANPLYKRVALPDESDPRARYMLLWCPRPTPGPGSYEPEACDEMKLPRPSAWPIGAGWVQCWPPDRGDFVTGDFKSDQTRSKPSASRYAF